MPTIHRIEDILAWQKAHALAQASAKAASVGTFARDFALKDQILRSSTSVMDNIAEGFGRGGNGEFRQSLSVANGSLQEVKSQLYSACDRGHISEAERRRLADLCDTTGKLIRGFMRYLAASGVRGSKWKPVPTASIPQQKTENEKP